MVYFGWNNDGIPFSQYHQNEQPTFTLNQWTQITPPQPDPGLRETQRCGELQSKHILSFHLTPLSILSVTDDHEYVQKRVVFTEFYSSCNKNSRVLNLSLANVANCHCISTNSITYAWQKG
jgi:hypothetical protein